MVLAKNKTTNTDLQKHLIIIAGPTAIGKTALAIQLAQHFKTEIISADSRQFYNELKIGTAAPTLTEMQGIPHHFIGNLSIEQYYNVGQYEQEVIQLLETLFQRYQIVILCGGSGLFIDAVCHGLDNFENIDENIRKEIRLQYQANGLSWLQEQVKSADPDYYQEVDIYNPQRLCRALEVCRSSGKPYSSFRSGQRKIRNFQCIKILLNTSRQLLYQRINQRVEAMIQAGLKEEVASILTYRNHNALNTVGYKELIDYFDKKHSWEKAIELIQQNTRRYAKRQLTWFRKDPDYHQFEPQALNQIMEYIRQNIK